MKLKLLTTLFFTAATIISSSCNIDEAIIPDKLDTDEPLFITIAKFHKMIPGVIELSNKAVADPSGKDQIVKDGCMLVNKVTYDGGKLFSIGFDFGSGCMQNGVNYKGKVTVGLVTKNYLNLPDKATFENFSSDDLSVSGTINLQDNTEQKKIEGKDLVNLSSTANLITLATNDFSRTLNMYLSWSFVEGQKTATIDDDLYNFESYYELNPNGWMVGNVNVRPACKWPVSGSIYTDDPIKKIINILDFGTGECDDIATLRSNGTYKTVKL